MLDVKVTGKNLLDKSIILPLSSYDIKDGIYWRKYFYLLPNTDYLIRVTPHYTEKLVDTSGFLGVGEPYDNNLPNGIISLIPDVGTTDKTNYFRTDATGKVILKFKDSANEENIRKMLEQVEITLALKTFNNEHEPYTEQSVQIALDEPLRGIGDYKDVLTKDGVVRKIHEQTLKKEQISMNEYNWDTKYFRLYVNPDKKIDSSINIHELFSNMFKKFVIYKNNPNVYWIISEEEIRSIGITEADSLQVAYEKIKDFVTTNDIVIQYPIVETTLEPLPESVPAQLQALHTENGTTHVFVDSGEEEAGINIEYKYKS